MSIGLPIGAIASRKEAESSQIMKNRGGRGTREGKLLKIRNRKKIYPTITEGPHNVTKRSLLENSTWKKTNRLDT